MKGTLKHNNPHKKSIELDKEGKHYIIEGVSLERVTHWLEQYTKPFEPMNTAIGVRHSHKTKGEPSLSPDKLVHYWNLNSKRSNSYGTGTHCFAEMYIMDNENTIPDLPREKAVVLFLQDILKDYKVIGVELRVYSKKYKLAGTIDLLLQHSSTGKYLIVDWKTSSNIDKTYNKLKEPFKLFPQSKRMEYELQLGAYKLLGFIELPNHLILRVKPDEFETSKLVILNGNGTYSIELVNHIPEQLIQEELEKRADYEEEIKGLL